MVVRALFAVCTLSLLAGCVVRTIADVATAPVRVAGKAVDLSTTSQSEADEKRGRDLRRREERLGELERQYRRHDQACARGDDEACERRDADAREIARIRPTVPYSD